MQRLSELTRQGNVIVMLQRAPAHTNAPPAVFNNSKQVSGTTHTNPDIVVIDHLHQISYGDAGVARKRTVPVRVLRIRRMRA